MLPELNLQLLNERVNFLRNNKFFSNKVQSYDNANKSKMLIKEGDEVFLLSGRDGFCWGKFVYGEENFSEAVYRILKPTFPEEPESLPNGYMPVDAEEDYLYCVEETEKADHEAKYFYGLVKDILNELYN